MALETLRDGEVILGEKLSSGGDTRTNIYIDRVLNEVTFRIQNGPIKEIGVNGCQVDAMIETARKVIFKLNEQFPCRENACALTKLDEALMWLEKRTKDREQRGVEGHWKK